MENDEMTDVPETVQRERLWVLASPTLLIAACTDSGAQKAMQDNEQLGTGDLTSAPPSTSALASQAPTPQFLLGSRNAPNFLEIGFSIHCGASRNWLIRNFPALSRAASTGQKAAMFSHVVRTDAEMDAGKRIMAVDPNRYGDAMMAVLSLSISEERSLSASEIASFLQKAGYPRRSSANDKSAELALLALRSCYEAISVKKTPYIKEISRS